jgi:hypothetical protein
MALAHAVGNKVELPTGAAIYSRSAGNRWTLGRISAPRHRLRAGWCRCANRRPPNSAVCRMGRRRPLLPVEHTMVMLVLSITLSASDGDRDRRR